MRMRTIEVEIDGGRISPKGKDLLPESGRALLTMLPALGESPSYKVLGDSDSLPEIQGEGGVITFQLVREIEMVIA